ncbi:Scr1 family TA system antitoxin-like transcriptional regulator [Streptomyces sp. NPDC001255]|uniref:Scr1 family TA system antitoxin-like transcriptional regulator n=1 Tax=Streptomyces sp. NPDC001255 TaxID=3364550 RepID=UPI0036C82A26
MAGEWNLGRRRLGDRLRDLRKRSGRSAEEAARAIEHSLSTVSRIETGKNPVRLRDVMALLDLYGVSDQDERAKVTELHAAAQREPWWSEFDPILDPGMGTYADLEDAATDIRLYENIFVPGLAQRPEYAREILTAAHPDASDEEIALRVRFREDRQKQLLARGDRPLRLRVVVEESVLRRPVGGPDAMRLQIDQLHEFADRRGVTLQIMPLARGAHAALRGGFTILTSRAPAKSTVYIDCSAGNLYVEKPAEVAQFAELYDRLQAEAAGPQETHAFLDRLAREIGHEK